VRGFARTLLAGIAPKYAKGALVRVIHVVQTLVAGGAETMIRTLCPGLAAAGIDVGIVSVYPSGLDEAARARLGVPVLDLGRRGRGDLRYFVPLVRTLRAQRPDVVHAHLHTGQYAGRAAALLAGVPAIVLTAHGDEPGGPVRALADRVLHARTARFIVFSEAQRRRFAAEQHVPLERVVVIPNGVVAQPATASRAELRAQLGIPAGAFAVYCVGRLAPEKNQRALLDALALVRDAGADDVHLVIAGDGSLADELRAYAGTLELGARVHFLGHRDDAPQLGVAMDLYVQSSLRERMSLALGEAMLGGLPPVVTPWDGASDLVRDGETGFVAAGFTGAAVAQAILRAYHDRDALGRVAHAATERAQAAFDAGAMVRAHVALYESLLSC
jgi:glycosyltransferase involved in cell wall biosynthesis